MELDSQILMQIAAAIVALVVTPIGSILVTEVVKMIGSLSGNAAYVWSWIVSIVAAVVLMFSTGELTLASFSVVELAVTIAAIGLSSQGLYDRFFATLEVE